VKRIRERPDVRSANIEEKTRETGPGLNGIYPESRIRREMKMLLV